MQKGARERLIIGKISWQSVGKTVGRSMDSLKEWRRERLEDRRTLGKLDGRSFERSAVLYYWKDHLVDNLILIFLKQSISRSVIKSSL